MERRVSCTQEDIKRGIIELLKKYRTLEVSKIVLSLQETFNFSELELCEILNDMLSNELLLMRLYVKEGGGFEFTVSWIKLSSRAVNKEERS